MKLTQTISPLLLFDSNAKDAINYYVSIFALKMKKIVIQDLVDAANK